MSDNAPHEIVIRPATPDDIDALLVFVDPFVADGRLMPRTAAEMETLVQTGFVAVVNQMVIGFAALEIYSSKLAEIRSLAVAPIYQGLGIGRKLVDECVALARLRKVMEVMAITSSEEFFRSCGFDFVLPRERKALFLETAPYQTPAAHDPQR